MARGEKSGNLLKTSLLRGEILNLNILQLSQSLCCVLCVSSVVSLLILYTTKHKKIHFFLEAILSLMQFSRIIFWNNFIFVVVLSPAIYQFQFIQQWEVVEERYLENVLLMFQLLWSHFGDFTFPKNEWKFSSLPHLYFLNCFLKVSVIFTEKIFMTSFSCRCRVFFVGVVEFCVEWWWWWLSGKFEKTWRKKNNSKYSSFLVGNYSKFLSQIEQEEDDNKTS